MEHLSDGNGAVVFSDKVKLYCKLEDLPRLPNPNCENAEQITFNSFHELPKKLKWQIEEGTLNLKPPSATDSNHYLAQRWLWVEVLFQTLGYLPNFDWKDFHETDKSRRTYVTTRKLPDYIRDWFENEKEVRAVKDQKAESNCRLIRIQQVLDKARYFVSRCVAIHGDNNHAKWDINPILALSLMVLGQTLERAQRKIQRAVRFKIQNWSSHDLPSYGWGYSRFMLERLITTGWCPKAVHRLMALLRGNTIGLVYLETLRESSLKGPSHVTCNKTQCNEEVYLRDQNQPTDPTPYHHCNHPNEDHCEESSDYYNHPDTLCVKLTPDGETDGKKMARIIKKGKIPLIRFDRSTQTLEYVKMSSNFDQSYAVFSHVWADGFGCFKGEDGKGENKLPRCVLNMFSRLLTRIAILRGGSGKVPELFWIDTLCIPESHYMEERLTAIGQMHNIYTHADYTVVLDLSLMKVGFGSGYSNPAMRITMSKWMTRLWTLQEAVLSRNIFFNFKDGICSMRDLEELFETEDTSLHDCLPAVSRLYWHSILGDQRLPIRRHIFGNSDEDWKPNAEFLALVWKAAQWRTTSHKIHETLSLATMLNVETKPFAAPAGHQRDTDGYQEECDKRMIQLLLLFSKLAPCPIPPGMIFLPGPRLSEKGLAWAP